MDITLHFSLQIEGGDMVDSNFDKEPATFTFGDGSLLPGFEQALVGMKAGARTQAIIEPEKGFGQSNPQNIQIFKRDSFNQDIELAVGLVLSFADAAGGELPGVVAAIGDDQVTVDFNHPLAGRTIIFDAQIIGIKPTTTH
nr:peptidylprolyl isomerase [Agarilytica rhodophyticola]